MKKLTEGDGIGMEGCVLKKKSKTVKFTNIGKLQSELVSLGYGFPTVASLLDIF